MGKPVKELSPTSADYDARLFSFGEKDLTASLTLVAGKERFVLDIGLVFDLGNICSVLA